MRPIVTCEIYKAGEFVSEHCYACCMVVFGPTIVVHDCMSWTLMLWHWYVLFEICKTTIFLARLAMARFHSGGYVFVAAGFEGEEEAR